MKSLAGSILLLAVLASAAAATISISEGLTRDFHLQAGESQQGVIEIRSSSDEPVRIRIYQTDYRFYADGSNHYDDPGAGERSNAGWIDFSPRETTLDPHGTAEIYYQIDVPADADLHGSYWSMMMVEPVPQVDEPEISGDAPSVGLKMVIRHGIQVSVTVDGQGETIVEPRGELLVEDGATVLSLEVDNTGDYLVQPTAWAEIYDEQGKLCGKLTSGAQRIFPGCSVEHRFRLDFPPGRYQALVILDNQDGEVWGSRYNMDIH